MSLVSVLPGGLLWIAYLQLLNHERARHGPGLPIFLFLLVIYTSCSLVVAYCLIEWFDLHPVAAQSAANLPASLISGRAARFLLRYYLTP